MCDTGTPCLLLQTTHSDYYRKIESVTGIRLFQLIDYFFLADSKHYLYFICYLHLDISGANIFIIKNYLNSIKGN
jgi:hypothetical protein